MISLNYDVNDHVYSKPKPVNFVVLSPRKYPYKSVELNVKIHTTSLLAKQYP